MKKIGIVSSFDTFCGNATYADVLSKALSKVRKDNCEIKEISLNQEILRDF